VASVKNSEKVFWSFSPLGLRRRFFWKRVNDSFCSWCFLGADFLAVLVVVFFVVFSDFFVAERWIFVKWFSDMKYREVFFPRSLGMGTRLCGWFSFFSETGYYLINLCYSSFTDGMCKVMERLVVIVNYES
jgi:hypothetical protein